MGMDKKKIDFLVSINPFTVGKELRESDIQFNSIAMYEAHSRVCVASDLFIMALIEDGWLAFVFKEYVYIYPCSVSNVLLTDVHRQANLN
jgi:hypothetical protein